MSRRAGCRPAEEPADVPKTSAMRRNRPKGDINEAMFVLNDGSRKVEFHHFGWAHTRGDGFVYLPKEQCFAPAAVNGP